MSGAADGLSVDLAAQGGDGLETRVPGDPAAFHALATYLRAGLSARTTELGSEAAAQRRRLATSWQGAAGVAFGASTGRLAEACDQVAADLVAAADQVDTLGDVLHASQVGLAALRAVAPSRGLEVVGTRIHGGHLFGPEMDLIEFADASAVWQQTREAANAHWRAWYDAVNEAGGWISDHSADLVGVLSQLVTVSIEQGLGVISSRILAGQAAWLHGEAARLRSRAAELADYIARSGDRSLIPHLYELQDEEIVQRNAAAGAAEAAAREPRLPAGVKAGLGTLGALGTGVGIYADLEAGESAEQATTSQLGGALTGTAAAMAAGAAAGSVFPGAGTITGAVVVGGAQVVGGVIGSAVGNKVIDAVWPGDDDSEDRPSEAELQGRALLEYAGQVVGVDEPFD